MSAQPEALRLADEWDGAISTRAHAKAGCEMAAELRRLHAVNSSLIEGIFQASENLDKKDAVNMQLLEALEGFVTQVEWGAKISGTEGYLGDCANKARAAIAAAKEQQ